MGIRVDPDLSALIADFANDVPDTVGDPLTRLQLPASLSRNLCRAFIDNLITGRRQRYLNCPCYISYYNIIINDQTLAMSSPTVPASEEFLIWVVQDFTT